MGEFIMLTKLNMWGSKGIMREGNGGRIDGL